MPKEKRSRSVVLNSFVSEYSEFTTDSNVLFCKFCEVPVTAAKKFQVVQHLQTAKHIRNKQVRESNKVQQTLLTSTLANVGPKRSKFNEDLCKAFLSADIPLAKLNNKQLKEFLETYTNKIIPDESTLRKNYVSELYKDALNKMREKARDNFIWVSLDETTDVEQRYVANFVFGVLGIEHERDKSYLLTMEVLEKVNHSTIAAFFNNALNLLWPSGILYEHVLLVCTDAAPYMCKAMSGLEVLYPKMIHVTCLAHGLHRVADLARTKFPNVNSLISTVKKVFIKAPSRRKQFLQEVNDMVPLPPSTVVTRWGTWIQAAAYYADNFDIIKTVVQSFNPQDAECISEAQSILKKEGLREELIFVKTNLECLATTITKLEKRGMQLGTSIKLIETVANSLKMLRQREFSDKLNAIISKNIGFKKLCNINNVFINNAIMDSSLEHLCVSDVVKLEYAPIVSCEVERVFSEYKNILSGNRRNFVFSNLLQHCIIKCNQFL